MRWSWNPLKHPPELRTLLSLKENKPINLWGKDTLLYCKPHWCPEFHCSDFEVDTVWMNTVKYHWLLLTGANKYLTKNPHQNGERAAPKLVEVKTMNERMMIGRETTVCRTPTILRRLRQCRWLLRRRHILSWKTTLSQMSDVRARSTTPHPEAVQTCTSPNTYVSREFQLLRTNAVDFSLLYKQITRHMHTRKQFLLGTSAVIVTGIFHLFVFPSHWCGGARVAPLPEVLRRILEWERDAVIRKSLGTKLARPTTCSAHYLEKSSSVVQRKRDCCNHDQDAWAETKT